jgi:hypothetical protein
MRPAKMKNEKNRFRFNFSFAKNTIVNTLAERGNKMAGFVLNTLETQLCM